MPQVLACRDACLPVKLHSANRCLSLLHQLNKTEYVIKPRIHAQLDRLTDGDNYMPDDRLAQARSCCLSNTVPGCPAPEDAVMLCRCAQGSLAPSPVPSLQFQAVLALGLQPIDGVTPRIEVAAWGLPATLCAHLHQYF